MSIEMKKNSQIFQDSNNTYYPEDELQVSNLVQELYKKNQPTEKIHNYYMFYDEENKLLPKNIKYTLIYDKTDYSIN